MTGRRGLLLFFILIGVAVVGCFVAATINKTMGGIVAVPALVLAVGFKSPATHDRAWPPKYW